jgi:hypothetical protein
VLLPGTGSVRQYGRLRVDQRPPGCGDLLTEERDVESGRLYRTRDLSNDVGQEVATCKSNTVPQIHIPARAPHVSSCGM